MIYNGPIGSKMIHGPKLSKVSKWSKMVIWISSQEFSERYFFLGYPIKELCSPEDCDRSGGGRWALERPLRLGLGLKGKLNVVRKIIYWLLVGAEGE